MSDVQLPEDDDYSGKFDLQTWRRILRHVLPYRGALAVLVSCGLAVAAVDVILPLVSAKLIDAAVSGQEGGGEEAKRLAMTFGAVYAGLLLLFSVFVYLFIVMAGITSTGVAHDLRRAAHSRLQELEFAYFDVRPVGWLVTRLTSDCNKLSSLIPWFSLDLVWGSSTIVLTVIAMLWLDWRLALTVLAIVPPLALISVYFQQQLLASSRLVRKTASKLTASYNECLMGARTTKTLVREQANLGEFQQGSQNMQRYSLDNAYQSAMYLPLVITLGWVGVGLALAFGGVRLGDVDGPGGLSAGELVAFMTYATFLAQPVQELARRFTELQGAQAAAERIQSLLDTTPEIRDGEAVLARLQHYLAEPDPELAPDGFPRRIETIELRNVDFWYDPAEPVLEKFSLTVQAGQTVALVGATGGGKSTIVSLVCRFYEPTRGQVLLDGVDYRERSLDWYQSQLGVVLQTPHLFSGTVRENIRYGRLDASDDEVEEAARRVHAHDVIEGFDKGYETEVGEGGGRLSTGQRQLISLARAVLADPQVFVMDEATSSVDTETEGRIQAGVEAVLSDRIAFVIAHRLSTIRAADVILVIDQGRIVERGSHAELLAAEGRYFELYTRQSARDASLTGA